MNIVLDLRCLQDQNYAVRGVGRHALTLLRHAPSCLRLVGLVDPAMPALLPEARAAVAAVHINAYAPSTAGSPLLPPDCVVMLSPMTHDPLFLARLLSDTRLLRAAVVYDFIPRRAPERYLPTAADRLDYAVAMRWLAHCTLFAPISQSAANDVVALLGVARDGVSVTGAPVDPMFERAQAPARDLPPRHLLVVGGSDPRKNPEVVIRAHAGSKVLQTGVRQGKGGAGIPLVIAGNYGAAEAEAFRAAAAAAGGRPDLLEIPGYVPDADLLKLYGQSLAIVCASLDEGFSLPVVEGMAAGLPCLASDIPAHAELVTDPAYRFPPTDPAALRSKLEQMVADAGWREAALTRQASVWPQFRGPAVAGKFWAAVMRRLETSRSNRAAPTVLRGHRPRVALLSPLPPDRSGVADYTAATCPELGRLVDLHLFTETAQAMPLVNTASILPLTALPCLAANFDRVVHVLGNSHFHLRPFELLLRYGGAAIAHDARMLGFYRVLLGQERALKVAAQELDRKVSEAELNVWLGDEGRLEALFLGEIAANATPTIVHSPVTARMFPERYGVAAAYLPFSIYRPWQPVELVPACRAAARARLSLLPDEIAIASFGFVHSSKAPEECVWALETLRAWNIPASLHFVGGIELHPGGDRLRGLVAELGLQRYVRFADSYVSEQTYRDYLVGADLAVQLRTYGLGGLSGALLDCAAAGLPAVANESLGAAVGVPSYIRCIPDALSPLLLAEALADLLHAGLTRERPEAERRAYSEQRSFRVYARGLCDALGLDTPRRVASPAVLRRTG